MAIRWENTTTCELAVYQLYGIPSVSVLLRFFLQHIFGKKGHSNITTAKFQWIVEKLNEKYTNPALLKTLQDEMVGDSYINDLDPEESFRFAKNKLLALGYNHAVTVSICRLLHEIWELNVVMQNNSKPVIQFQNVHYEYGKLTNVLTRMMDFWTGHIEPYHYAQELTGYSAIVLFAPDRLIGALRYDDNLIVSEVVFIPHTCSGIALNDVKAFGEKLVGRKLRFGICN